MRSWRSFSFTSSKPNRTDLTLRPGVLPYFSKYAWPGNVRQLENAVERLVLLAAGPEVRPQDLPDFMTGENSDSKELPHELNVGEFEKQLILQALEKMGGNQTRAAQFLGMSRRVLAYRLEKYNLKTKRINLRDKEQLTRGGAA